MDSQPQDSEQDNDALNPTPDDDLEAAREDPIRAQVDDDALSGNTDRPAANPTDVSDDGTDNSLVADDTHPSNDTDVDEAEVYDQGL